MHSPRTQWFVLTPLLVVSCVTASSPRRLDPETTSPLIDQAQITVRKLTGPREQEPLVRYLRARVEDDLRCWKDAPVRLSLTVLADGSVGPSVEETALRPAAQRSPCVLENVRKWHFNSMSSPQATSVEIEIEVVAGRAFHDLVVPAPHAP